MPSVKLPLAFPTCTIPCPQVKPRAKVTSGSAGTNLGSCSPSHWVSPRHQPRLPATRSLSYPSPLASGKIWPKPKLIWQPSPGSCIAQSWCRLPAGNVCSNILSLRHPEATSLQENLLPCWGLVARQGKERKIFASKMMEKVPTSHAGCKRPHCTFTIKYLTNCYGTPPGGNFRWSCTICVPE